MPIFQSIDQNINQLKVPHTTDVSSVAVQHFDIKLNGYHSAITSQKTQTQLFSVQCSTDKFVSEHQGFNRYKYVELNNDTSEYHLQ